MAYFYFQLCSVILVINTYYFASSQFCAKMTFFGSLIKYIGGKLLKIKVDITLLSVLYTELRLHAGQRIFAYYAQWTYLKKNVLEVYYL